MELFKRFPSLCQHTPVSEPIVSAEIQKKYPAFSEDFEFLEKRLMRHFHEFDNEALNAQRRFRREQIALIIGGALATIAGVLQATFTGLLWFGIIEGILATLLAILTHLSKRLKAQEDYFTNRLKAEALRSEYFLFLGRIDHYVDNNDRYQQLILRVANIADKETTQ